MSNDDSNYQPISCETYSEFELAIMRQHKLKMVWRIQGQTHIATVLPLDLITREQQEFLLVEDHTDNTFQVRLDHIQSHDF